MPGGGSVTPPADGLSTARAAVVVEALDDVRTADATSSRAERDALDDRAFAAAPTELSGSAVVRGSAAPVGCGMGGSVAVLEGALAADGVGGAGEGRSKLAPNIA